MMTSIIILTKNEKENLRRLIPCLLEQKHQGKLEILVVDSGSTDGSISYLKRQPIRLLEVTPSQFGHGKTRNLAAKKAQGEILVFLSPDAMPKGKDGLVNLIKPLEKEKVAGVFGRQTPYQDAPDYIKFFYQEAYPLKRRVMVKKDAFTFSFTNLLFSNVNSAVKKSVWQKVPFSTNALMSEDQLWAHEVLKQGGKIVYEPKAAVFHSHSYSFLTLVRRHAASGYSLKNMPAASWPTVGFQGACFIIKEMGFLLKKGKILAIPGTLLIELVRVLAWLLGRKADLLPEDWRKRLLFPARRRF